MIAAIIVAGRSGSAFTAEIGTMKLNQEIDAIETFGFDTIELLVLPRVLGLVLALPLLTLYADAMTLLGGFLMCYFYLNITLSGFLNQLQDAVTLTTLWVGLVKAPVFAFIIAFVGCFEGLRVEGNAESVGRQTTRSVVESLFSCDHRRRRIFDPLFNLGNLKRGQALPPVVTRGLLHALVSGRHRDPHKGPGERNRRQTVARSYQPRC